MSDKPEFRFPVMSWGDSKQFAVLQARLRRLNDPDTGPDETAETFDALSRLLARFVVSVPQSWLMDNAPKKLDWSDPASFDWLRTDRMADLQAAMQEARTPEESSGN